MTGTMTHNILLTRLQGEKTILLTRDGVPKDPYRRHHGPEEEGRMTPTLPPFVRQGSLQSPTFCWMLCDPSVFYRIWFWPSADAENTKPDHDEKSLHRHTIPCFASSKSPFGLQLGSRETPHASHRETEEERCLRRNQRRAAQAFWVRCEPSTPRHDPKTGGLARSSRRRAQPFLPTHCRSEGNQACLPGPLCSSSREGVTHSVQVARWARTLLYYLSTAMWGRINQVFRKALACSLTKTSSYRIWTWYIETITCDDNQISKKLYKWMEKKRNVIYR